MPYNNVPKDLWPKMDSCVDQISGVNKRTKKPYTKGQKVAICYSRIVGTSSSESGLSGEPLSDFVLDADKDGLVTVVAAEDGSPIYMRTAEGPRLLHWRPGTLRRIAKTWVGTHVGVNHLHSEKYDGTVVDAFAADIDDDGKDELVLRVKMEGPMKAWLDQLMPDVFTSVEAVVKEIIGDEISDAVGAGNTFVVAPKEPACPPDNCYVLGYKMGDIMPTDDEDEGCCGSALEYELDDTDFASEIWRQDGPYWDASLGEAQGAVLTAKTRKALPDSAFCGPGRSFPAHDAAHARNGLARLRNSKFSPAVKARIHACLARKAKRFGVQVSAVDPSVAAVPDECIRHHIEEALACMKGEDAMPKDMSMSMSGKHGDMGWYFSMSPPPKAAGTSTVASLTTTTATGAGVTSVTSTKAFPADENQKPPAEASSMSAQTSEIDALKAEIEKLKAGNQEPPGEGSSMSEDQIVVALKTEIEALKKERDELKKYHEDRHRQEKWDVLVELKNFGIDVREFDPFSLDQLKTIAAAIKAGRAVNSGAVATKPGLDEFKPEENLAKQVAGERPPITPEEYKRTKDYERGLLGMQ